MYFLRYKNKQKILVARIQNSHSLILLSCLMKYLKYINLILAIAFIAFAVVQINDPDSGLWIAAYMSAALVSIIAFLERMPKKVLLGLIGLTAIGVLAFFPNAYASIIEYDPNLKPDPSVTHTANVQTENIKEIGGLLVILVAFVFQYFTAKKQ